MKAIPRKLLIHTAAYKHTPVKDKWNKTTYSSVKLERVRIEPSSAIKQSKDNQQVQLRSLLFYDCRNSSPTGLSFATDNLIAFNGQDYTIVSAEPLYDNRQIHHWELGLI